MTMRAAMIKAVRRAWEQCCQTATDPLSSIERRAFYTVQAALLDAAADALAAEDWRPIAECPEEWKDGRAVDLWGTKSNDAAIRPAAQNARRFTNCRWRRAVDVQGDFLVGWYEGDDPNLVRPTHVRPLPAPPAREG